MALIDLLTQQVDVYHNTRTVTTSGGRRDVWTKLATVAGRYFVRQIRGGGEKIEAGDVTDPGIYDFVLDVSVTTPDTEHALTVDGRWFRIVTIQVQDTWAFVRAREVDPLA